MAVILLANAIALPLRMNNFIDNGGGIRTMPRWVALMNIGCVISRIRRHCLVMASLLIMPMIADTLPMLWRLPPPFSPLRHGLLRCAAARIRVRAA